MCFQWMIDVNSMLNCRGFILCLEVIDSRSLYVHIYIIGVVIFTITQKNSIETKDKKDWEVERGKNM